MSKNILSLHYSHKHNLGIMRLCLTNSMAIFLPNDALQPPGICSIFYHQFPKLNGQFILLSEESKQHAFAKQQCHYFSSKDNNVKEG